MTLSASPQPRVLLTIATLERGGAERMVVELGRGFAARNIPVEVCYLDGQGTLAPELIQASVPTHCLNLPHKAWPALFRLRKHVRAFQPNIIHAHMPRAAFWSSFTLLGARLIYTEHNVQEVYPRWADWLFRRFVPRTDLVIAVSPESQQDFLEKWHYPPEKCTIIRTGVPLDLAPSQPPQAIRAHHNIDPDEFLICAVGAVRPSKAYSYLAEATKILLDQGMKVRTLIVGSTQIAPEEAEKVRQTIHRLGIDDKVQLVGEVPEAFDYIAAADLFALSSVQEGLPRVILEAMVASKPVVATNVGGCTEAIVHGETGLIVPPRNPKALAEAIKYILTHPEEARKMGQAGHLRVKKHFSIDAMIEKHLEAYRRVLKNSSPR